MTGLQSPFDVVITLLFVAGLVIVVRDLSVFGTQREGIEQWTGELTRRQLSALLVASILGLVGELIPLSFDEEYAHWPARLASIGVIAAIITALSLEFVGERKTRRAVKRTARREAAHPTTHQASRPKAHPTEHAETKHSEAEAPAAKRPAAKTTASKRPAAKRSATTPERPTPRSPGRSSSR